MAGHIFSGRGGAGRFGKAEPVSGGQQKARSPISPIATTPCLGTGNPRKIIGDMPRGECPVTFAFTAVRSSGKKSLATLVRRPLCTTVPLKRQHARSEESDFELRSQETGGNGCCFALISNPTLRLPCEAIQAGSPQMHLSIMPAMRPLAGDNAPGFLAAPLRMPGAPC